MGKNYGSMKPKKKKMKMVKKIKPNKMAKRRKAQGVTGLKCLVIQKKVSSKTI